jgi:hypothetical protein
LAWLLKPATEERCSRLPQTRNTKQCTCQFKIRNGETGDTGDTIYLIENEGTQRSLQDFIGLKKGVLIEL